MEILTDSGSEQDSSWSDLDGSERSVVDLEKLMDLVNPTGKSSSRSSKRIKIPIFDTTIPSTSGEPTTYFDHFEKFDASIQVEPEPSAVQGIEVSGGSPAAVGDVSLELDPDTRKSLSSSLDHTPQNPINTLENFINEASCSVNGDRIFIEFESNNSLPSSPNPGNSPSLNIDETNLNSPDLETELRQNSVIETALEKKDGIYLPHEMITITKESRKLPFPYRAKMMYHSDFEDYSIDPRYSSIRPGTKANEPVVTDIRCLRDDPSGIISYKLDFDEDFQELPRRPKNIVPQNFPPLFREPLQISKDKWDDLQTLKTFIPIECQQYYENLPHQEESYKETIGQQKKKEERKRKLVQTAGTSGDKKKIKKKTVKKD